MSVEQKGALIEPAHQQLNIRRQCVARPVAVEPLSLTAAGERRESAAHAGDRRAVHRDPVLERTQDDSLVALRGCAINPKRVDRLMRVMGLEASRHQLIIRNCSRGIDPIS
jgi:hypothetical protein